MYIIYELNNLEAFIDIVIEFVSSNSIGSTIPSILKPVSQLLSSLSTTSKDMHSTI